MGSLSHWLEEFGGARWEGNPPAPLSPLHHLPSPALSPSLAVNTDLLVVCYWGLYCVFSCFYSQSSLQKDFFLLSVTLVCMNLQHPSDNTGLFCTLLHRASTWTLSLTSKETLWAESSATVSRDVVEIIMCEHRCEQVAERFSCLEDTISLISKSSEL